MSQTIELPDESAALLRRQAAAQGLTLEAWVQVLARGEAAVNDRRPFHEKVQLAVARILALQKSVKPDPEGWTVRDYIDRGRP